MKRTVLSNSLPKICLAMGLMLGPSVWNAYALPMPGEAQQVRNEAGASKVSGTVLDENGEPVISASVKVKGTDISVPTDINGKFTLAGVNPNSEIQISYVGYVPTTLKISQLVDRGAKSHLLRLPKTLMK